MRKKPARKNAGVKTSHMIFFAIPFDSASRNLYNRVSHSIRARYPTVTVIIGNKEVGPSPAYSDISSFKVQNRELNKQFVAQIRASDIVIADLTHNNPNVHFELGIALHENKNILRVTGRSHSELGFDIRNLEVNTYADETQLTKTIFRYLDTFFRIKKLTISKRHGVLYHRESTPIRLRAFDLTPHGFDAHWNTPVTRVMRDSAIRVSFEILRAKTPDDWFGVYFRAGTSPIMGSHLVYVRQNGAVEMAIYPGPIVLASTSLAKARSGIQELTIEFENEQLAVRLGTARLVSDKLVHQTFGQVLPAAWDADVDVHSVEMICRDTIEPSS